MQLLTGTPLTSRPRDLFVLLQLAAHPLGRSFLAFAKRYCAAEKGEYGWKTGGASNIEELTVQLHGVMLRRSKDDVLSLPPKLRTWLPVDVPSGTGARAIKKVFELLAGKDSRADAVAGRRAAPSRQAPRLSGGGTAGARVREGRHHARLRQGRDRPGREGRSCFRASTTRFRRSPGSSAPRPSS